MPISIKQKKLAVPINIPLFMDEPKDRALFEPHHYLTHKGIKALNSDLAVIVFNNDLFNRIEEKVGKELHRHINGNTDYTRIDWLGKKVTFIKSGIGGAASGPVMEELIALGIKNIIFMGYAGSLKDIPPGTIIIPKKAIRDEGVSFHYMKPGKYVKANGKLTEKVIQIAKEMNIAFEAGTTWTTDAPYRETIKKIRTFQKESVVSVEMEAASLFAIARFRKVEIAGIFWVSDKLQEEWEPHFQSAIIHDGLSNAYKILEELVRGLS
jgi:uridine phosphorylase